MKWFSLADAHEVNFLGSESVVPLHPAVSPRDPSPSLAENPVKKIPDSLVNRPLHSVLKNPWVTGQNVSHGLLAVYFLHFLRGNGVMHGPAAGGIRRYVMF